MAKITEVLKRLAKQKQDKKAIVNRLKEALQFSSSWREANEKLSEAKTERGRIEMVVLADYQDDRLEVEKLNTSIKSDQMILTDIALTMLMKGQALDVQDRDDDVKWTPQIKISFKQQSLF